MHIKLHETCEIRTLKQACFTRWLYIAREFAMDLDDVALSDVHLGGPTMYKSETNRDYQVVTTRFLYNLDPDYHCDDSEPVADLEHVRKAEPISDSGASSSQHNTDNCLMFASDPVCDIEPEITCVASTACNPELIQNPEASSVPENVIDEHVVLDPETLLSPELPADEDGDLVVCRRAKPEFGVITIKHTMATRLIDVGLQVWQGCLLLCDFIMNRSQQFSNSIVLELGGGTGLASVVMATVAKAVICTDIGEDVLKMCQENLNSNRFLFSKNTRVIVRELDWMVEKPEMGKGEAFPWRDEDIKLYDNVDTIIAADVVYDDDLTDAFFRTIYSLMCDKPGRQVIIALEKRLNFTLCERDVACPAYDHYHECLDQLHGLSEDGGIQFTVREIKHIKQYFHYDRTKYLELWHI